MTRLLFELLTHQLGDASLQSIKPCVGSEANYYGIYLPLKEIDKDLLFCYAVGSTNFRKRSKYLLSTESYLSHLKKNADLRRKVSQVHTFVLPPVTKALYQQHPL